MKSVIRNDRRLCTVMNDVVNSLRKCINVASSVTCFMILPNKLSFEIYTLESNFVGSIIWNMVKDAVELISPRGLFYHRDLFIEVR